MHPMEEYTIACLNVVVEYCRLFKDCRGCIFYRETRAGDKEQITCVMCDRLNEVTKRPEKEEDHEKDT